ncbi:MAG: LysR family transcriptional regulator [Pseudomonadota bacterium]|nr:LysR family transcriptional regulator [Pseudomonadota bacterium]URQ67053.1 LysR family transcriptional regulator [SAR86 cluster bacterium]URQ68609.1 LysR family transcriptional regulator [SAR86 cluster bacterium]
MKIKDTDLNLFIAFDVIYTEKNLTKSGQVLGITQPAVSNALARLRDLFNDELFIRTSRGMIPTPVANQLIGDIRNALSLIQNTISVSEKFDPSTAEMTFKISIGDTSEYRLLPLLIKELAEIAPRVKVETYLTPRKDAPRELASGAIDFSIDPPLQSDQHLKHEKIYQEDYVMIVRKDHPILDKEKITIEDYLDLSHIHISNRKTGMGHVDMTLYKLGLTRDIYLRAQHFLVAPYIVEQSDMAITTTKGFAVDRNLAWRELPFDIDPLVLHLYWHENNDNESSSKWMRDLMLKTYGKLQQVS